MPLTPSNEISLVIAANDFRLAVPRDNLLQTRTLYGSYRPIPER